jgi:hypothetical protein
MKNVALYIYIDELIDDVLTPIRHRLELFADESISVTSSITNFRDLAKIFTDYSKAFTIPASSHNNKILYHWYNSEVGATIIDNPLSLTDAFDHRITYYGYIEIDTIPFRYGKWSLKGSKKTDNKIESYSINFTGNLVQLKERFKDDKLNAIAYFEDGVRISPYDALNHAWNLTQVKNRVDGNGTDDILYPVIGTKRKLFLSAGATAADNISTTAGKLKFDEIFPAIRVTKILEYIQTCYGIQFDGAFIQSQTFSKLFLYLKNQDEFVIKAQQVRVNFTSKQGYTQVLSNHTNPQTSTNQSAYLFNDLNLDTDVVTFDLDYAPFFSPYTSLRQVWRRRALQLTITVTAGASNPYNLYVYNNGILYSTFENIVGTATQTIFALNFFGASADPDDFNVYNFTFFVSSDSGITFESTLTHTVSVTSNQSYNYFGNIILSPTQTQILRGFGASQSTTSNIDIKSFVPDITVISFIEGLIKMFNIMVIPTSETSFYLEPLTRYYNDGNNIDITEYVIPDSIDINPPQLFKRIAFKFEKSINILNEFFRSNFNKEFGDLNFENQNSAFSETYEVALPFEDFIFERETATDFLTATIFNKDIKAYVPKPSLIYCNGAQLITPNIKIGDNSTTIDIDSYVRFSNELALAGSDVAYTQSLSWGAEVSAWDLDINFVGLYQRFYSSYIENLFNQRTRILKLKAMLPTSLICSIKLKDKMIVSNKRYLINTMTPELTTGETSFELILDNSPTLEDEQTEVLRFSNLNTLELDNKAQVIEAQIFLSDNDYWQAKTATGFLTGAYFKDDTFSDGLLNVSVPANATGLFRDGSIVIEFYKDGVGKSVQIPVTQNA